MYTIDYNYNRNSVEILFFHGTSSANVDSILQQGLIRPDFDAAIARVLETAPHLQRFQDDFLIHQVASSPLAIDARRFHANAHVWAWLGNKNGLSALKADIERVVPHGGEIYEVTQKRVTQFAQVPSREWLKLESGVISSL